MNWKFFGQWYNKKYPLNSKTAPSYTTSKQCWDTICETCKQKIVTDATTIRENGLSAMFFVVVFIIIGIIVVSVVV